MPIFSSIFVHEEFRHDEERYTGDTVGAAFDLGQHKVDDVVGHVVLTGGDKDLLACDLVTTIFLWGRFGAHQAQIGAAMWLCQVHGAGPFAGYHVGQESVFLLVRAVCQDG